MQKLQFILTDLIERPESEIFRDPVDFETLGLTDYPKIVKKPMDLGSIKTCLDNLTFKTVRQCLDDIQLVWDNCKLYNMEGSEIYKIAMTLEEETKNLV